MSLISLDRSSIKRDRFEASVSKKRCLRASPFFPRLLCVVAVHLKKPLWQITVLYYKYCVAHQETRKRGAQKIFDPLLFALRAFSIAVYAIPAFLTGCLVQWVANKLLGLPYLLIQGAGKEKKCEKPSVLFRNICGLDGVLPHFFGGLSPITSSSDARFQQLAKEVGSKNPDLVCFSECNPRLSWLLLEKFRPHYSQFLVFSEPAKPWGAGAALFVMSKVPFKQIEVQRLSRSNRMERFFVGLELERSCLVFTHLQDGQEGGALLDKKVQARDRALKKIAAWMEKKSFIKNRAKSHARIMPVCLIGDLNTKRDSPLHKKWTEKKGKGGYFADLTQQQFPGGVTEENSTFTKKMPHSSSHSCFAWLDHIWQYVPKGHTERSLSMDSRIELIGDFKKPLSDHRGVYIVF